MLTSVPAHERTTLGTRLVPFLIATLTVFVLAACDAGDPATDPAATPPATTDPAAPAAPADPAPTTPGN